MIELWFAIYSGWSGQIIYERWTIGLYNVFFTALPPFAIGIFDKVCSAETMLKYPALYKPSQSAQLFNVRVFWIWIGNALVHSVILFWAPMLAYGNESIWGNGKSGDYLVLGNIVYTVSEHYNIVYPAISWTSMRPREGDVRMKKRIRIQLDEMLRVSNHFLGFSSIETVIAI